MAIYPASPSWIGQPQVKGSSETMRMFLLTLSMVGLSFCWGTEFTYANPFLLSLGMSKSSLSLVWVAGPLSGLVVQPIIGVLSDQSTSKYGRRRPYMLAGTAAVAVCYLVLGWSKEIVQFWVRDEEAAKRYAIMLSVVDIYILDFVINISQSTCRALVVDTLPISKQQAGSAWIGRQGAVGTLLVYGIGALDLQSLLGDFLGDTQFKKVCFIAVIGMAVPQCITCWAVQERVLLQDRDKKQGSTMEKIASVFSQIYATFRHVPDRIQNICWVQFWSWIGYFPFLFYCSTWVGEIYLRHEAPADLPSSALDTVGRRGSMSMIVWSVISFVASIVLPWFVENPARDDQVTYTARPPPRIAGVLGSLSSYKPTLLTTWAAANLLFASAMIFAPLVQSVALATFLIALCGVPWAVAQWAPTAFIGIEINRISTSIPLSQMRRSADHGTPVDDEAESSILHLRHDSDSDLSSSTGQLAGAYLGLLNIYTTLPQFVGTAISWVVFSIFEPGQSAELSEGGKPDSGESAKPGVSGIGVCLFIGAICAVRAAWSTRRLRPG